MAKQPFEPSEFPAGERQLDIARSHVTMLQSDFGGHLPDHVISQLDSLEGALQDALDADDTDTRLEAIETAGEHAEALQRDSAFNPTLSKGLQRRVERMLLLAKNAVASES